MLLSSADNRIFPELSLQEIMVVGLRGNELKQWVEIKMGRQDNCILALK